MKYCVIFINTDIWQWWRRWFWEHSHYWAQPYTSNEAKRLPTLRCFAVSNSRAVLLPILHAVRECCLYSISSCE